MLGSASTIDFRTAQLSDAPRLADIFKSSWSSSYRDIIPAQELSRTIANHDAAWWRRALDGVNPTIVFEIGGQIGGYATYGPSRQTTTKLGEIYELYLAPEYQGLGHGTDLFEACRARLDLQWSNGLIIWVLSKNTRAIDFYQSLGGEAIATRKFRFAGVPLQKTLMAWDLSLPVEG
ncbi:MAG: GNAT family N-acetyltransferase [Pseudomonadota bacterium]